MKKLILTLFVFFIPIVAISQITTFDKISKSDDSKVVTAFIKDNPNHPRIGELKQKLVSMASSSKASVPKTSTTTEIQANTPVPQFSKFKKYKVGNTVMEIYFPEEPEWEKSVSDDKIDIYTTDVHFSNIDY
jgi:hypothetical protein